MALCMNSVWRKTITISRFPIHWQNHGTTKKAQENSYRKEKMSTSVHEQLSHIINWGHSCICFCLPTSFINHVFCSYDNFRVKYHVFLKNLTFFESYRIWAQTVLYMMSVLVLGKEGLTLAFQFQTIVF